MREATVDIGGPIAFDDYGGDGPAMVLLHGIGGSKLNWQMLASRLEAYYHVFAADMPGFGRSPLAGRRAGPKRNVAIARDFIERVAGGKAIVGGHSMGGLTTMLLAASHPETVSAAVLFDPAYPTPVPVVEASPAHGSPRWALNLLSRVPRLGSALATLMVRFQDLDTVVRGTIVGSAAPGASIPEETIQAHIAQERERLRAGHAYLGYLEAWREMHLLYGQRAELEAVVAAVTPPTLLLHGIVDTVVPPAAAKRLHDLRADWKFEWLEGVGHNPIFEKPDLMATLVRNWLSGIGLRKPAAAEVSPA